MDWRRWSAAGAAAALLALLQGAATAPISSLSRGEPPAWRPSVAFRPASASSSALPSGSARGLAPVAVASANEAACHDAVKAMFEMTQAQRDAATQRLYDAMASSSDPKLRAAGMVYEISTRHSFGFRIATDASCRPATPGALVAPGCLGMKPGDAVKDTYVWTPLTQLEMNADVVDRLAQLALASSDPVVYAMAMHACRPLGADERPGPCSQLSVAQWARLDGSNAVVWLHMIDEAQKRGDPAAVSEALYRLSLAQTSQYHLFTAGNLVVQNLPPGIDPRERLLAEFGANQASSNWALPRFAGLAAECRQPAISDMNRAQVCERIAEFLATRDTSAIGRTIGRKLGEELGWPVARLKELQLEEQASLAHAIVPPPQQGAQGDCRRLRRVREWAVLVDQLGEVKAAQEEARRSGVSVDQLKARYLAAQAARAASASAVSPDASPQPESP